jgi:hypothetical protein
MITVLASIPGIDESNWINPIRYRRLVERFSLNSAKSVQRTQA